LNGEAVNVTCEPKQRGLAEAEIVKLTSRTGFTVIVIVLLLAGFPVGHVTDEFS
jgi:hypothetical protein